MLNASKDEAVLAVRLYNEPSHPRALEGFIVHMHLAWLYLLQAKWKKSDRDYRIPNPDRKGWFVKVEDEDKTPPLAWFVEQSYDSGSAVRANLEFFIRLRNKIEHRHSGTTDSLATVVSGECHSLLLNYEEELVEVGGQDSSLAHILRFPVFIGGFTERGKEALVELSKQLPSDLRTFLAEYDGSLDDKVSRDPRYCLRLTVFLEHGNRKGDLSMQFRTPDDLTDEQLEVIDEAARQGFVITKRTKVPVSGIDLHRPRAAVALVSAAIPFVFHMSHFVAAWKRNGLRPAQGAGDPSKTRADFCVWDEPHGDYVYTNEYINYLKKKCSTAEGFRAYIGSEPTPKAQKAEPPVS